MFLILLIPVFVLLVILLLISPCLIPGNNGCIKKKFVDNIKNFISIADFKDETSKKTYIIDKIAVINRHEDVYSDNIKVCIPYDKDYIENKLSHIHFNPRLIKHRAARPGQANTVILLDWSKEFVGEYRRRKSKAYKIICDLYVVDRLNRTIIGKRRFIGSKPPKSKRLGDGSEDYQIPEGKKKIKEIWGRAPNKKIVDYILSLPVKEI